MCSKWNDMAQTNVEVCDQPNQALTKTIEALRGTNECHKFYSTFEHFGGWPSN